ncbi:DUF6161 domain-containing protein [Yoonia sp. R2-816]|uniref:DUF6161 domain-containing protein n=1 Tax=Yoonia sp. R2-816 TaxID=3342638 RepID=UPI003728A4D0
MAKFTIEVPFGCIEAESYTELKARIGYERDFWTSFGVFNLDEFKNQNVASQSRSHIQAVNEMSGLWNSIYTRLDAVDGRQFTEEFESLKNEIESNLGFAPKSNSNLSKAAKIHFDGGRTEEALRLLIGYLISVKKISIPAMSSHAELGAYYGAVKSSFADVVAIPEIGIEKAAAEVEREVAVVRQAAVEASASSERISQLEEDLRLKADNTSEELTRQFSSVHKRILKAYRSQAKLSKAAERNREEEFTGLQKAFNLHLRIQRPVELWQERQDEHTQNARTAWLWFVCASLLLGLAAFLVAVVFDDHIAKSFVPASCTIGFEPSCDRLSPKGPLTISMILLVSTVWLWYLRFQMKIHLSERHLALDARERRAFAETYLSLLKGDQVTQEHESVVLQSLFRPTQDGIIKDEGGPDFGVASLLSKALDRNK